MEYYKTVEEILKLKKLKDLHIDDKFYPIVFKELSEVVKTYSREELHNRIENISGFIKYEVNDGISWCERIKIIVNVLKKDSSSEYSFKIRYGEKFWKEKFDEKNNRCKHTLEKYNDKYGLVLGAKKWKEKYEHNGCSLKNYINRYGEVDGREKFKTYSEKRMLKYCENKNNGKKYRNGRTLNEYISLYGEYAGREKYFLRNKNHSNRFKVDYYIKNFGFEKGMILWNEYKKSMNKTSLESYIRRYGEDIGTEKYKIFIEKLVYHNSLEYFVEKFGEDIGLVKWNELRDRTIFSAKTNRFSKISQLLFWKIYEHLNDELKKMCYFAELNREYFFRFKNSILFSDFKIGNIVIEFDGEYWHSFDNIKKLDEEKDSFYFMKNILLLRIPEREFLKNRTEVIEKCVKFINDNIK